ncbi:unnamed protein product [Arabis nemorensis]|uniref:Uncharacterized protein n=1 Tax=Arabis nemorensis TaxID=586526 RepID=A0A565CHT9_9BRAS|nr:unnamed protein product [Arabis nemorensis]
MKLQEEARAKEMVEAKKLQEGEDAKAKEKLEARKLQEEAKAKEKLEERKLVEEATLEKKNHEKNVIDESGGKEKILKQEERKLPKVVYTKIGLKTGAKSESEKVDEAVVKEADEKLDEMPHAKFTKEETC